MTLFWATVVLISVVAMLLMLRPVWKKNISRPDVRQDQLNVAIFEDRLAELETELASGVLPQERYEQARNELRRDLLQNTGGEPGAAATGGGRWMAFLVGVLVPFSAVYIYLQLGSPELVDKPPATVQAPQHRGAGSAQAAGDMDTMIQRLHERLQENPEDIEGWVLLGRSMAMLQRYDAAADAYRKAYELAGDVPEIMAQYAETLALTKGGRFEGQPTELLEKAIKIDPQSSRTLWLLGVVAAQRGERDRALEIWNRLLTLLPPESEAAKMVQASISQLGSSGMEAAEDSSPAATGGSGQGVVKLHVAIAPELQAQASPGDAVFIFARAQGSRMPLAVVRHLVSELPLTLTLDDSSSMAGQKLSDFEQVTVVARVSKGASAVPQAGDLEGDSAAKPGSADVVSLIIDQVLP